MNNQKKHRRKEASDYLFERHGVSYKPSTLAKMACLGGGPKYQLANKVPLYSEDQLDAWVASIMSPLKSSTSDNGGVI